ncbi:MAG: hypothetical protein ACRDGJ_08025 [Candidatus Limnocylindria bacterium]
MTDLDALRRLEMGGVLLAIAIGIVSTLAVLAAFGGDFEAATFGHPEAILDRGRGAARLFRWAFLGDLFFSYLLLVPLALFLHRRLPSGRSWVASTGSSARKTSWVERREWAS